MRQLTWLSRTAWQAWPKAAPEPNVDRASTMLGASASGALPPVTAEPLPVESDVDRRPARSARDTPTVWIVGGDDVRLRIPLACALADRGFDVTVVGADRDEPFVDRGIPYRRYYLKRGIAPWSDQRSRREVLRLFRDHRPDLVHALDGKPVMMCPLEAGKAGVRGMVCTVNGIGYAFASSSPLALALRPVYLHLHRRALKAAQITAFQNNDDREYFLKARVVPPGRDRFVPGSGIDVEQVAAARPDSESLARLRHELLVEGRRVVTMVSRITVLKGVREYIEAARVVRRQVKDVSFLLVGPVATEGTRAVPMRELERSAEDVRYLGPRNDVLAILALSDVFVFPSYFREGVPRVLLEAGATGLPLITTNMPGCRDVVRDGWNGLLVPPRDRGALTSAILRLLASEDERTRMGNRSRRHVAEGFSLARVADDYAEIYRSVLLGPAP